MNNVYRSEEDVPDHDKVPNLIYNYDQASDPDEDIQDDQDNIPDNILI